jgi:hypothetical protein
MLAHQKFKDSKGLVIKEHFQSASVFDATERLIDFTVTRVS